MSVAVSIKPLVYLFEYEHGIDDKRRLQIPSKWRREGDGEVQYIVFKWQSAGQRAPCLLALPPEAFQKLFDKVTSLGFGDATADTLRRTLTRDADTVSLDSAGRICLPQRLADAVHITKRAVLVGMWDRFEIWNPEDYQGVKSDDEARKTEALKLI